jgi:hypothetical protein
MKIYEGIKYHILGSDYAEFARRDIGDVTITHIRTPCKKSISISARVQKMHINDVTMKKYVTKIKSVVKYFIYYGNFSWIVYDYMLKSISQGISALGPHISSLRPSG